MWFAEALWNYIFLPGLSLRLRLRSPYQLPLRAFLSPGAFALRFLSADTLLVPVCRVRYAFVVLLVIFLLPNPNSRQVYL